MTAKPTLSRPLYHYNHHPAKLFDYKYSGCGWWGPACSWPETPSAAIFWSPISFQNSSLNNVRLSGEILWTVIILTITITAMTFEPSSTSLFCSKLLQLILFCRILLRINFPVELKENCFDCGYYYLMVVALSVSLQLSPKPFCPLLWKAKAEALGHRYNDDPSTINLPAWQSSTYTQQPTNYIEYNLADYCTEETWSDYPGRHLIRLEKSLKIRLPSIIDFQFNETHRHRLGFFRPGLYPIWPNGEQLGNYSIHTKPTFVPYCLLSFSVDYGHRIYAEGLATGLMTGGKEWFTETLHFKTIPLNNDVQPELYTFTISTIKNSLTLVFEQLHLSPFSFHLILTPFRDAKPEYVFGCESDHEYQCTNQRCIAKYLACDHHNNCGDYSDEAMNCMFRVPTTSSDHQKPDDKPVGLPDPSEMPTFPIDPNSLDPNLPRGFDEDIPEYIDVPLPTDRTSTISPKPINGFHAASGGGFLDDLFRFNSETSNVVKVVRYLLALLVIIILVTLINFLIWCLITKRDQSFMAPVSTDGGGPLPEQSPQSISSIEPV